MAHTTLTDAAKETKILWQNGSGEGVGEPALVITPYFGCFQIEQGENIISINYETVADLCKVLKSMKEPS